MRHYSALLQYGKDHKVGFATSSEKSLTDVVNKVIRHVKEFPESELISLTDYCTKCYGRGTITKHYKRATPKQDCKGKNSERKL